MQCPECGQTITSGKPRGLALHLVLAHGIVSDNPKTRANRKWKGLPVHPEPSTQVRSAKTRANRRALGLPEEEPFLECPDGPVALLEMVIAFAWYDRHTDPQAWVWLRDIQTQVKSIRRGK